MQHITVLKEEAVTGLNLKRDSQVVDCTFGGGGHSKAILHCLEPKGKLLAIDLDPEAFEKSGLMDQRLTVKVDNFRNIATLVEASNMKPDAIIADLGWRSEQFEEGGKGFSFKVEEPLLMTFGNPDQHVFTAHDVVNAWDEENLADIIYHYGEERAARKIAQAIVQSRQQESIETSAQLANIVDGAVGRFYRRSRIHPATKTFQAIRIAVNDELGSLETLLKDGFLSLATGGRMVIISFHSLEDRLVKNTFRDLKNQKLARLINKKPITPTPEEVIINPRSRSAKLRILEKI
ncbi:16S rRNA (cytosine(1402)-N(4))-methyltransferase [bacterium]|nr:16S rRNA (cytosine(1402)-N(4))-methyltransferase [bacterium]|tara:strand:+ start:1142 stop:2017 length:876 start_codon:yes stop_codon:yes gene_type:complete